MKTWQKNLTAIRERQGMSRSELAKASGCSPATITRYETEEGKGYKEETLNFIAKALRCSVEDFFSDKKETGIRVDVVNRISGEITPSDIRLIVEWLMTQPDPIKMASNIRYMVETRYPDFEDWQKKRNSKRENIAI